VNVALLLDMVADGDPDRLVFGSRVAGLTAAQLRSRAQAAAVRFRAADVEHVALVDLNSEVVPVVLFGAAMAGLPFAPLNYRLTDEQLQGIARRLAPAVVVVGPDVAERLEGIEGLQLVTTDELMADDDPAEDLDLPFVDPEEVAVLLFTSGTTGEPKAAVLRHRHLTSYILTSVEFLGADPEHAQLVSVPPYHVAGVSSVLSSLYSGRRVVYLPGFEPESWVAVASEEQITQAMVVPTMLGRILDVVEQQGVQLTSLRHLSYGGGRMPLEVVERTLTVLPHVDLVNAYGLTETSSTVSILTPDDHREAAASDEPALRARLGSVGRPMPTIELEIRGEDGSVLPVGERGEIYVRGEQVSGEYLGRSLLTDDGWFPTNDAGRLDADGFLYLEGRLDDVIVRGGENLSPGEIEDVLCAHPAVAEAAVVGIPDPEWGEAVAAAVVLRPGEEAEVEDLQAWVQERLRSTRTPQVIQLRDELPYNETGKLLRRVLRDELADA